MAGVDSMQAFLAAAASGFNLALGAATRRRGTSGNKKPAYFSGFAGFLGCTGMAGNRYMVPKGGLEPPRLASLPPQGSASTNSATWAKTCSHPRPSPPTLRVGELRILPSLTCLAPVAAAARAPAVAVPARPA